MENDENNVWNIFDSDEDIWKLSDTDDELTTFEVNKNMRPVEKRTIEMVQHQLISKMNYKRTAKTAQFVNDDSTILLPDSEYKIKKRASELRKYDLNYQILLNCKRCDEVIKKGEICSRCGLSAKKNTKNSDFFIYIPLEQQLRQMLNEHFQTIINFICRNKQKGLISDTDDGNLFKDIQDKNSFLHILSLTLNIDGGNIYNSSKKSLWPIQLYQNYLPPEIRFRPENILIVGLYFGNHKPDAFNLLYPLAKELSVIQSNKISIHDSSSNGFFVFSPYIVIASCDLPAKHMLINFVGLSGHHSCSFCYHPGESVKNAKGTTNVRYTYRDNCIKRTHKETIEIAVSIGDKGPPVKGIKGRSVLELFDSVNIVDSCAIDFMHGIAGIVKHIIEIWIGKKSLPDPPYKNYKIKTLEKRKQLNKRILSLKPYSGITRKPRSIFDISVFKASEFLMFLWFYLPLTINGIVDKKLANNFKKLSVASYNLCKKAIDINELETSFKLISDFSKEFEEIYGKCAVTNNLHLLIHYKDMIKNCGPLWSYSLFGFEANIGVIKNFVCGPTNTTQQIAEKYLNWKSFSITKDNKCVDGLYQPKLMKLDLHCRNELWNFGYILPNQEFYRIFRCLNLNGIRYTSLEFQTTKSIDYFVQTEDANFGKVRCYFEYSNEMFFLLKLYEEHLQNTIQLRQVHWKQITETSEIKIYKCSQIRKKLLYFKVELAEFISEEPNIYNRN